MPVLGVLFWCPVLSAVFLACSWCPGSGPVFWCPVLDALFLLFLMSCVSWYPTPCVLFLTSAGSLLFLTCGKGKGRCM